MNDEPTDDDKATYLADLRRLKAERPWIVVHEEDWREIWMARRASERKRAIEWGGRGTPAYL